MDYKSMKFDDIVKWCVENKEVEWLKKEVNKTYTTKKGEEKDMPFIQLKRNFCEKFMADLLPVKKEKKPSMRDIVKGL